MQSSEKSESPPPPETSSLDSSHQTPRVKMPTQVVVKLPVKAQPVNTPKRGKAPQGSDWQSRINTLLGVKSDAKPSVNTLSKASLDEAQLGITTVSLPTSSKPSPLTDGSDSPMSKASDEEVFPQPEFGSTPRIQIPRNATYVHQGEPAAHYRAPHRHLVQLERDMAMSRPSFDIGDLMDTHKGTVTVTVHIDAKRDGKDFTMTVPSRKYQRGGFANRFPKRDAFAPRGRKTSSQFPRDAANMPRGAPRQRSGRGSQYTDIRRQPVATGDA